MSSNAEKFLDAFVSIEMYLKDYLNHPGVGFTQMVYMASKTNALIKRHATELNEYAQLRNAIVHSRVGYTEIIAQPHDNVVTIMQSIHEQLISPKKIVEVISVGSVYTCNADDMISDVLEKQVQHNYSVVPVYDKDQYVGVIHMRLYQRFLEVNRFETLDLKVLKVRDVLNHYQTDDRVLFADIDSDVNEIVSRYDALNQKGRSLIAIILTPKGVLNENPKGIITIADMPKIIRELE